MRAGGQELQFPNGVGAPLISPAQLLRRRKTKGKVEGGAWPSGRLRAGGGPLRPAAAPPPTFNLDFSLLAPGTGGKPAQMGVLSMTTLWPLSRPRADGDSGRTPSRRGPARRGGHNTHLPYVPLVPADRAPLGPERRGHCWVLLRGPGEQWRARAGLPWSAARTAGLAHPATLNSKRSQGP